MKNEIKSLKFSVAFLRLSLFCIQVKKEILKCYELIHKLGKGVVYMGSSRTKPDHPHFVQAMELGREVKPFLDYP